MPRVELHRDAGKRIADGNSRHLLTAAEEVAAEARRDAPVVTGAYRDGIVAVVAQAEGHEVGRVVARDWKSALLEFGAYGRPVKAGLRRAAEKVGLVGLKAVRR